MPTTAPVTAVQVLAAFEMDKHNLEQPMTYEIDSPCPAIPGRNAAYPHDPFATAYQTLPSGAAA